MSNGTKARFMAVHRAKMQIAVAAQERVREIEPPKRAEQMPRRPMHGIGHDVLPDHEEKQMKVTVSERALLACVNRQLAKEGKTLRTSRSAAERSSFSNYYARDASGNVTASGIDDLEKWVHKEFAGMLKPFETLESAGGAR
ncbi:hypothetical protein [Paraburkholderia sp. GAS42]|uniref:hypothetical protein n=1 Tax=Paraburkholderia sp. GAS42 TaxID=3035135 RepID=UPI003D23DCFC